MRKNKQRLLIVSPLLIFLVLVLSLGLIPNKTYISIATIDDRLTQNGYSDTEIDELKAGLKPDQILSISIRPYQSHVLDFYKYPHFKELIDQGYTLAQAHTLSLFDNEDLLTILLGPKIDQIEDWLKTPYLVLNRLTRYQAYKKTQTALSLRQIVERVNTDRDYPAYTHTVNADTNVSLILVNKYHKLDDNYVPKDLVRAKSCGNPTLTQEAAQAYDRMCTDITKAGLFMNEATSYRSYAFQQAIYQDYLKTYGQAYTDTIAARPGFSEHQTGLAVDLNTGDPSFSVFVTTKTYLWVKEHCTDYGFILRYPEGKEAVTGYRFESWHYRYVGIDTARKITQSGLTFDEYVLLYPE